MLTSDYWQSRYQDNQIGWDAGSITTPIKNYFDAISDRTIKILIPGCGNAHEAAYLFEQGFTNVYLCDWASAPLENFAEKHPNFPKEQLICANFFDLELKGFDYIVEQTFFCAIQPDFRPNYAKQVAKLLKKGGKLVGLLFNETLNLEKAGPPFGGNIEEYRGYFEPYFSTVKIEPCLDSIKPRLGVELFVEMEQ